VSTGRSFAGATREVLAHPDWWVVALAGFLVRGGFVLILLPIVPLPSTVALANALGPTLLGFVFGGVSPAFIVLVATMILVFVAWLVVGGLVGAVLELGLIRDVLVGNGPVPDRRSVGPWRALVVRWLAHLPTLAVAAWGAAPLVDAAYQELIHPGDPALPVAIRVMLRVPQVVGLLVLAWAAGEAVGGAAVRHLVSGASIRRSMLRGVVSVVRPSGLALLVLTDAVFVAILLAGGVALAAAFEQLRLVLAPGTWPLVIGLSLGLVSAGWLALLWLASVVVAWRGVAWTWSIGSARGTIGRDAETSGGSSRTTALLAP
jgi:hypothetical protein